MRYTKAMKAEQQKFAEQMRILFAEMGAKEGIDTRLGYQMTFTETLAGPYHVTIYPGTSAIDLGWIAGRFEDIDKAVALLGGNFGDPLSVNKFSGKWNHHFFNNEFSRWTVQDAIQYIELILDKIM